MVLGKDEALLTKSGVPRPMSPWEVNTLSGNVKFASGSRFGFPDSHVNVMGLLSRPVSFSAAFNYNTKNMYVKTI